MALLERVGLLCKGFSPITHRDEPNKNMSLLKNLIHPFKKKRKAFTDSNSYWVDRYESGRNSGAGSYNQLAAFKAKIMNQLIREHPLESAIEYGCGDGNQLKQIDYPTYLGFDVSPKAIQLCKASFSGDPGKSFKLMSDYEGERADLTISMDVIYHLVEDSVFEDYMARLFDSSNKVVVIYSSNTDNNAENTAAHVRHRKFTDWVDRHRPSWRLLRHIPNEHPYQGDTRTGSFADFYIYGCTIDEQG